MASPLSVGGNAAASMTSRASVNFCFTSEFRDVALSTVCLKYRMSLAHRTALSYQFIRRPGDRPTAEQARLDRVRGCDGEVGAGLDLAEELAGMIRRTSAAPLGEWLGRAEASGVPELRAFAEGLRQDEAAVAGALTGDWSNGPVERQVNRLKTIKRSMYGRAGFDLLRARVRYKT
jgi:transposase